MIELDLKMENDPMKLCLYLLKFLETTESNFRPATLESTFWQLVVWYYGTFFCFEQLKFWLYVICNVRYAPRDVILWCQIFPGDLHYIPIQCYIP